MPYYHGLIVFLSLNGATADGVSFIKSYKNIEKSANCCLSYCYGLYLFEEETALNEMLSFLKHEDYHLRCGALSLLSDIANDDNRKTIRDAVIKLLITENTEDYYV